MVPSSIDMYNNDVGKELAEIDGRVVSEGIDTCMACAIDGRVACEEIDACVALCHVCVRSQVRSRRQTG